MIPQITNEHIQQVLGFRDTVLSSKHIPTRQKLFAAEVPTLSPEANWLLTFCCWFCLLNFRYTAADASRFHVVPLGKGKTTFAEFTEVLKHFNRKRLTPSREKEVITFLARCNDQQRTFYMLLLNKQFTRGMPLSTLQLELDMSVISVEDLYGTIQPLQESFANLTYPLAVTALDSPDMALVMAGRRPNGNKRNRQYTEDGWKQTEAFLLEDYNYIEEPTYCLVGYAGYHAVGRAIVNPIDLFPDCRCLNKINPPPVPEFKQRIENLNQFLENHLLTQVVPRKVGYAEAPEELPKAIITALSGVNHRELVFTDSTTWQTGKSVRISAGRAFGTIQEYWVEHGEAKGFRVWFNGELHNVYYDFSGRNNPLLYSIKPCFYKTLDFYRMVVGEEQLNVGHTIRWFEKPWRKLYGKEGTTEKCTYCADTKHKYIRRGLCKDCEWAMYSLLDWNGADKWIKPTNEIAERRRDTCWEPEFFNRFQHISEGHLVQMREDGWLIFRHGYERDEDGNPVYTGRNWIKGGGYED